MSKSQDIWNIIRGKFPESSFALMREVSDKAGFQRSRSADYIAVGLYPSRGLDINGIELKSFRGDWLNELKNPKKAENIFQYCDYFWLLTADESIAKIDEIPPTWGWLCIKGNRIFVKKKAPKLSPAPVSRHFLAAMLKRACDKTDYVHLDSIEDRIDQARKENRSTFDRAISDMTTELKEMRASIDEFQEASGIRLKDFQRWSWASGSNKKMGEAVKFIEDGGVESLKKELMKLDEAAKLISSKISNGLKSLEL